MRGRVASGIRPGFPGLSRSTGQITHVLLTRSPLVYPRRGLTVRLACVKHAASVRPEPGSNSPSRTINPPPAPHREATSGPRGESALSEDQNDWPYIYSINRRPSDPGGHPDEEGPTQHKDATRGRHHPRQRGAARPKHGPRALAAPTRSSPGHPPPGPTRGPRRRRPGSISHQKSKLAHC